MGPTVGLVQIGVTSGGAERNTSLEQQHEK